MIRMKSILIAFAILIPLMLGVGSAFSAANQADCQALKPYVESLADETFGMPVTNVTATWKPASGSTPEYCQVTGWIWPEIQFQVSLPTAWNGRYINSGGGGWDGNLAGPLFDGLALGYATSGANGGYMGTNWPADPGSFGLKEPYFSMYYNPDDYPTGLGGYYGTVDPKGEGNPYACQKVVDFGIRHLKETPLIAKKIINHYYGNYPQFSYFSGGSCGGKEGQISAQKLYDIYDGFYIGCPLGGHIAVTFRGMWDTIQGKASGLSDFTVPGCTNWFFCPTVHSTFKAQAHRNAVYNKCDGVDGLVDGLIDDPRKCDFDALTDLPACTPAEEAVEGVGGIYSSTCFTFAQRQGLKEIYDGPHTMSGRALYVGQPLSAEYIGPGFFGFGSGFGFALNDGWAAGMFANIALDPPQGPNFDMMAFDWDQDPWRVQKTKCTQCYEDGRPCETVNVHDVLDAITLSPTPTPNMGGFERLYKMGGKIIQHHGWADSLVSALGGSIGLYESVMEIMGPKRTKSFYKLYMVPGAGHCGGGIGYYPTWNQVFGALVDWVENGKEPGALIGTRAANTDPNWPAARTRPVCPYPEVARYSGAGSIDDAANFVCVPPIEVSIKPRLLDLNRRSLISAYISVPDDYRIMDWNLHDITCEGAPAKSGYGRGKGYYAIFNTEDLQNVTPGESVTLTVKGTFTHDGKQAQIQASDTVKVIK